MGFAQIVGEPGEGRYTLRMDWGDGTRLGIIASLEQAIPARQLLLATAQAAVTAMEPTVQASAANLAQMMADIAAIPPDQRGPAMKLYERTLGEHLRLVAELDRLRLRVRMIETEIANAQRTLAYWRDEVVCIDTRDAWCATYTTGRGGWVATIEIPGEPELVLVAPGARAWQPPLDGRVTAREIMSPAQAYANAALLPGWQKWKPTYRWGTITGIDWDAETCTVELGQATSSAQRLDVNQSGTLHDVPVTYLSCGILAFGIDDRVVVQFEGQDWGSPRVIGFLDNPRGCPPKRLYSVINASACAGMTNVSIALGYRFTGGHGQRHYSVVSGTLPPGLSLDELTGQITGIATQMGGDNRVYNLVIRCADAYYEEGKNRRYADTDEFPFTVYDGWEIKPVLSTGENWGYATPDEVDWVEHKVLLRPPDQTGPWNCTTRVDGNTNILGPTWRSPAWAQTWLLNPNDAPCITNATWYKRVHWSGTPYHDPDDPHSFGRSFGQVDGGGDWETGGWSETAWTVECSNTGPDPGRWEYAGTYTIEIAAMAPLEENIVCRIHGSLRFIVMQEE